MYKKFTEKTVNNQNIQHQNGMNTSKIYSDHQNNSKFQKIMEKVEICFAFHESMHVSQKTATQT